MWFGIYRERKIKREIGGYVYIERDRGRRREIGRYLLERERHCGLGMYSK